MLTIKLFCKKLHVKCGKLTTLQLVNCDEIETYLSVLF